MDFTNLLTEQTLVGIMQLFLGATVKPQLKDKLHKTGVKYTSWIPFLNVILAYIGFSVLPASAHAASAVASVSGEGLSVLVSAVLQTVAVTGAHSTWKNSVLPALRVLCLWGAGKFAKASK